MNLSPPLQISELRLQIQQLEDENGMLSEKDAQNIADMESVRQQLAELMKENERREAFPSEEKNKVHSVSRQIAGRHGAVVVVASS